MKLHNCRTLPALVLLLAIFTANAGELSKHPSFSPRQDDTAEESSSKNGRDLAVDVSNWKNFEKLIDGGAMAGYFTLEQVEDIISQLQQQFPELFLPLEIIGQTYEKHDIKLHCLTRKTGNTTLEQEAATKSIAMITALHHPREPMSLSMLMFTFYRILVEYNQNNPEYVQLLNDNIMCFMPAFNVDGYLAIEKYYKEFQKFVKIRKNRNPTSNCPRSTDIGVDLNRNYGYGWDMPGDGSSTNPCQEDYRGPAPFSEPETQAMKAFVEKYQTKLKLIANLHAYGNLWIYPFNCYVDDKPYKNKRITSIYDEFKDKAPLPEGAIVGNAKMTVEYTANGEASDWLLGTFGIISFSPEIGLIQRDANGFFPNKDVIYPVVTGDYDALYYMMSKLNPKIELQGMGEKRLKDRKNRRSINMNLFNNAYRDISQGALQLEVKVEGIREGFLGNSLLPEIYITQRDMDNSTETSTPVSVGNIVTTKIKATNSISYDVTQAFEFKSWANTQVSVMVPHEDYESLHFELKVLERGHELYNYTQDFGGNQSISVMHNLMILVGSLAFAVLVTVAIIYGTQYYHNKVKATKSHNMYGASKPQKGLEFAQIGDESSVESSRI